MIFEKVVEIVCSQVDIPKEKLTLNSNFTEDLGLDSLDLFQIITELEDAYKIEFDLSNADSLKTIEDAVNYIKNNA